MRCNGTILAHRAWLGSQSRIHLASMAKAKRRAFITGVAGQDGTYLTEYLLSLGYEVWGLERNTSARARRGGTRNQSLHILSGDMRNAASLRRALKATRPDEIYNLAAQTDVNGSLSNPKETFDINYAGFGQLVNAAMFQNPNVHIFQASTSEMFAKKNPPQNEGSPFAPTNPYGESKLKAHRDVVERYRTEYNLFICSGFLFNHISPRSSETVVARKITLGLSRIKQGQLKTLSLGNLDTKRDWGFAGDYVRAMHLMLQRKTPHDYVIASGTLHSVRELVDTSARALGIRITWRGRGVREIGVDQSGAVLVNVKKEFYRPTEKAPAKGNSARAHRELGWKPKVPFASLVKMMVQADLARLNKKGR